MNEGGGKGDREEEEEEGRGKSLRVREKTDFGSNQYEKYFIFS